jgi:hypothetical protein
MTYSFIRDDMAARDADVPNVRLAGHGKYNDESSPKNKRFYRS